MKNSPSHLQLKLSLFQLKAKKKQQKNHQLRRKRERRKHQLLSQRTSSGLFQIETQRTCLNSTLDARVSTPFTR